MAPFVSRCLYFFVLLYNLRVAHVPVDNASLHFVPFDAQERNGLWNLQKDQQRHVGPDDLFLTYGHLASESESCSTFESRDPRARPPLRPGAQNQTQAVAQNQTQAMGQNRLDGGFGPVAEPVDKAGVAGGAPSWLYSFLLLVKQRLGSFSDMIFGSLPGTWRSGLALSSLPLGAVVFWKTLEILVFSVFTWRTVGPVTVSLPGVETQRKLLVEERKRRKLEGRVEALERHGDALQRVKAWLQVHSQITERRLEAAERLGQEKQAALEQKLIQEQFEQREMTVALNTYRLQIQEVRRERQRAEHSNKARIEFHQKRAYDSLMRACSLENILEQEREETERLRQLVGVSVRLIEFQLSRGPPACSEPDPDVSASHPHLHNGSPSALATPLSDLHPAAHRPQCSPADDSRSF